MWLETALSVFPMASTGLCPEFSMLQQWLAIPTERVEVMSGPQGEDSVAGTPGFDWALARLFSLCLSQAGPFEHWQAVNSYFLSTQFSWARTPSCSWSSVKVLWFGSLKFLFIYIIYLFSVVHQYKNILKIIRLIL